MTMEPGTPAPNFTLYWAPDRALSLAELRGRPVVLPFYPAEWSPVCGDQLALYNDVLPEFRPDDAPITLVEYGDLECSSCGLAYPIVRSIQRELGTSLRFVFRHFPLTRVHPHAQHPAEASEAGGAQGRFWDMHDLLYEHQQSLEDDDLLQYGNALGLDVDRMATELADDTNARRVRDDFRSGARSRVNGTPSFFINGERYDEPWSDEAGFLRARRRTAQGHAGRDTMAEFFEPTGGQP